MVTIMNSKTGRNVMTFAGVGLLSLVGAVSAVAQDRPMSGRMMNSKSDMRMMNSDRSMSDDDMAYPATMNYPIAAPGGLQLYHYTSYRRNMLADGSAWETSERHEMMMDRKLDRGSIKEDSMMVDPMPLGYPLSSPGGLDLYHFRTYNGNDIVAGSATEARMDKMMAMDRQRRMETRIMDDEEMADPAPMSYPIAAPGGLDLYHYRTYRGNTLAEGSTRDAIEDKQKKMDRKHMNDMGSGANK